MGNKIKALLGAISLHTATRVLSLHTPLLLWEWLVHPHSYPTLLQPPSQSALPCFGSLHPYGHQLPQLESPSPRVPRAAPPSGPSPSSRQGKWRPLQPAAFPTQALSGREFSVIALPQQLLQLPLPCSRNPSPGNLEVLTKPLSSWADPGKKKLAK